MKVNIIGFGIAREVFGSSCISLELDESATVQTLSEAIQKNYPKLAGPGSFAVAVNNEYALSGLSIQSSDEIAIIPPVSGG